MISHVLRGHITRITTNSKNFVLKPTEISYLRFFTKDFSLGTFCTELVFGKHPNQHQFNFTHKLICNDSILIWVGRLIWMTAINVKETMIWFPLWGNQLTYSSWWNGHLGHYLIWSGCKHFHLIVMCMSMSICHLTISSVFICICSHALYTKFHLIT